MKYNCDHYGSDYFKSLDFGRCTGYTAWNGEVNGKGIFDLSFDFLVERENLNFKLRYNPQQRL